MAADVRAELAQVTLRSLKLRPGMFLQAQTGSELVEAKFCAAIDGKGLMVVPLGDGGRAALRDGVPLVVRGFTGLYDFSFQSQVIQSFAFPFEYTLLGWPSRIDARQVRNALRIPTALPARVQAATGAAEAMIIDLSAAGAMLRSGAALGAVGEAARIRFAIEVDQRPVALDLAGVICHSNRCDSGDGWRTGCAFENIGRNERIALQCFTLEAVVDNA